MSAHALTCPGACATGQCLDMTYRPSRPEFAAGLAGIAAGGLIASQRSAAQGARPHRIDFHCHSVPPAWVAFLKAQGGGPPSGNSWILSKHLEDMDRAGVATSLLSVASPGIWHGTDLTAIRTVARQINEFNAKLGVDYPGRFGNFATLPLPDIDGSRRSAAPRRSGRSAPASSRSAGIRTSDRRRITT